MRHVSPSAFSVSVLSVQPSAAAISCSTSKHQPPAAITGERKRLQREKTEAKTREKRPQGLIEYYGSKMSFKKGGVVPPGFARGGPKPQEIARRRYQQPASP
jgi:hypothetical protein